MPPGQHIDQNTREILYHKLMVQNKAPQAVFAEVFECDTAKYSLTGLVNLKNKLIKSSEGDIALYLSGPASRRRAGRKRKFDSDIRHEIVSLRLANTHLHLSDIQNIFRQNVIGNNDDEAVEVPSIATISRMLQKSGVVRKVVPTRHVPADFTIEEEFLQADSLHSY